MNYNKPPIESSSNNLETNELADVSYKIKTEAALNTLATFEPAERQRLLNLRADKQEDIMREIWCSRNDYDSLSSHDSARALQSIKDFYSPPEEKAATEQPEEKSFYFPLLDGSEYHWQVENKFRSGIRSIVSDLTGCDDCVLPCIEKSTKASELKDYEFHGNFADLVVDNEILATQFAASESSFSDPSVPLNEEQEMLITGSRYKFVKKS